MSAPLGSRPHDRRVRSLRYRGFCLALWCFMGQLLLAGGAVLLGAEDDAWKPLIGVGAAFLTALMWFGAAGPWLYDRLRGRSAAQDQKLLLGQLHDLLAIGITVPEALRALATQKGHSWRSRFTDSQAALRFASAFAAEGDGLGMALARTGAFPLHWTDWLQHAEERGALLSALEQLTALRTPQVHLSPWIFIRLGILWLLALPVVAFLARYIMPSFTALYEGMELRLPASTQLLNDLGRFSSSGPGIALGGLVGLSLLWLVIGSELFPRTWARTDRWLLKLPPVRALVWPEDQARAALALAGGLRLGLPAGESAALAASAVKLPDLARSLAEAEGTLSQRLDRRPECWSPALRWLVAQGERHGNLEEALVAAAAASEEEAAERKQRWSAWADVASALLLGALVLLVVLAVYSPILQLTMALAGETVMP